MIQREETDRRIESDGDSFTTIEKCQDCGMEVSVVVTQ